MSLTCHVVDTRLIRIKGSTPWRRPFRSLQASRLWARDTKPLSHLVCVILLNLSEFEAYPGKIKGNPSKQLALPSVSLGFRQIFELWTILWPFQKCKNLNHWRSSQLVKSCLVCSFATYDSISMNTKQWPAAMAEAQLQVRSGENPILQLSALGQ